MYIIIIIIILVIQSVSDYSCIVFEVANSLLPSSCTVPAQAIVFMGVIFFLLLLLVLFFLYLNKAMCFANCGGFPCLESDKPVANKEKAKLGKTNTKSRKENVALLGFMVYTRTNAL